jgi:hypothetical protein
MILLNYIIDPANLFSGIETRIAEYLSEGYNVKNVPNIDERLLQKQVIDKLSYVPSTIILGASTIMLIGNDFYGPDCLNNSVSGGNIEDLIAIYQLYAGKGYSPDKVVIGINHYTFNKNRKDMRWKSLSKEYYDFFGTPASFFQRIPFNKYIQLIFPSYFRASVRGIPRFIREKTNKVTIEPTNEKVNDTFTRLAGGTISYDLKKRSVTVREVERIVKDNNANKANIQAAKYTNLSDDIQERFSLFINTLKERHTEIEILLIPIHPIMYDKISNNQESQGVLKTEEYIKAYAEQNNITLKGSFNPAPFGLEAMDFYDAFHQKKEGLEKVLRK